MFFPSRPKSSTSYPAPSPCFRAQIRIRRLQRLAAAVLWLAVTAGSVPAQTMTVDSFSPTSGAEDIQVHVSGTGFATDPTDQWAFVHNPLAGLGVMIDPLAGNATSWTGVLGPAPDTFTGTLTVWKGIRWELPSVVFAGESGAYLVRCADWFVRLEKAEGPGTFTVTQSSGGTIGSIDQSFAVAVDFSSLTDPTRIDLNVVIDGGGDPTGGDGTQDLDRHLKLRRNGGDPARALKLAIDNVELTTATPEAVARDVGAMLAQIYGPFGLRTNVQGAMLYITWKGAARPDRAFAVLHWES